MTDKDKTIKRLQEKNQQLEKQVDSLLRDKDSLLRDKDHLEEALRNERAMMQMRVRRKSWDTIQMSQLCWQEV
jgi:peptidoglycan hydrolase CwlO-like protein